MFRIGQGWDRHRLAAGQTCVLGGVTFNECEVGPVGHSDGDAACHAVIDAVLGALALDDIGALFPDTDERWADADSLDLLDRAWRQVAQQGYRLGNLDLTIIAERPMIGPRRPEIRAKLARVLKAEIDDVSVKATRGEGLGPEGRGECITALAVVLLEKA